jgi:hypothetical protein
LQTYRANPASKIKAPSLIALHPTLDSLDNFYPISDPRSEWVIKSPTCASALLPPVVYYRVQAPNNSFKPKPLRGSA